MANQAPVNSAIENITVLSGNRFTAGNDSILIPPSALPKTSGIKRSKRKIDENDAVLQNSPDNQSPDNQTPDNQPSPNTTVDAGEGETVGDQTMSDWTTDESSNELGAAGLSDSNLLLAQANTGAQGAVDSGSAKAAGAGAATSGANAAAVAKAGADAASAGSFLGGISTTTAAIAGGAVAVVSVAAIVASGGSDPVPSTPNDAPTATNLNAAETYTEDTALNLIDIVSSDVDSATLTATLTLSDAAAGNLSIATSGAVNSTYNVGTGVWSATGAIADVNTLLAGVTFTPALNFNANFNIATSVSDGVNPAITSSKAMTGTAVNDAPVAVVNTLDATADTPVTYSAAQLLGNDTDVDANTILAIASVTSGTGGTAVLNPEGTVTFTPAANFNGAASFSYIASDGTVNSNSATVTVNVAAVNVAPTATNLNAAETYTEDTALNLIDIVASDVDSATLTATLTLSDAAAGNLSIATSGAVNSTYNVGTGVWSAAGAVADVNILLAGVTFAPALNFNSNFTITTSVSDSVAPVITGSKIMTGTAVNDAPVAVVNTLDATEDTPVTYSAAQLLGNDTDVDANTTLAIASVTSGTGGTGGTGGTAVLNLDGTVTFTPAANFNGTASFSYIANDGTANSNSATVTVNVAAVNDAPTATNLNAAETYTKDTALNLIDIVASDVDSATLTATLTMSDAAAGNLSIATSGAVTSTFVGGVWSANGALADVNTLLVGVTFTPTLNYNSTFIIATSVSDGVAPAITGVKTLTGTAVNNAPALTAGDGRAIIQVGAAYDAASSMTLQADGKILVAGRSSGDILDTASDFSLIRMNTNGRLDTTFDVDGRAIIPVGVGGAFDEARSMSLQADGKILLAGNSFNSVNNTFDFSLIRLNANGSLDATFDGDGKVLIPIDSDDRGYSMTLQADGRILVAGYSQRPNDTSYDFNLIRLNADGSLDDTFNKVGIAKIAGRPFTNDFATSVTLQADGKILVAGFSNTLVVPGDKTIDNPDFALIRLNSDGSLDTTFDVDGWAIFDVAGFVDQAYSMTLQADGKILVAGFSNVDARITSADYSLIRLNTDGSLDTTFGVGGKAIIPVGVGLSVDQATSMTLQADGKILVAGSSVNAAGNADFSLIRLNTNGSLDTTFDNDGKVIIPVGSANDAATSMTLQADGKILVAGYAGYISAGASGSTDYSLIRLNTDGSLDTSFGNSVSAALVGVSAAFTENSVPVVLNGQASVFDADLAAQSHYGGASLTLVRSGGANTQDLFSGSGTLAALAEGGTLSVGGIAIGTVVTNSSGTLMLNFDSNATQARVNGALQQIAYSNSSNAPPASVTIDWLFNDGNVDAQGTGGALVATGSTTVLITALSDPDQVITGNGGVDVLSGGFGNDTITGYVGYDILTGGAGSDRFDYNSVNDGTDTITDFTLGVNGDVLDLHDVLGSFIGYTAETAFTGHFLQFVASGTDTLVQVDSSGVGDSYISLAVLTNTLLLATDTNNYLL